MPYGMGLDKYVNSKYNIKSMSALVLFKPLLHNGNVYFYYILLLHTFITCFYCILSDYCPIITNITRGGQVQMRDLEFGGASMLRGSRRFSCTWQLKIPEEMKQQDMQAFIQFTKINVKGSHLI